MSQKIDNNTYKGTKDYFPADFERLQYIFTTWRDVCKRYQYREYLTPVLEKAEIYEAKSGEDITHELYTLTDQGGRRLCLRPEMTPSVTRMVTRYYNQEPKPIRLFSIANFFRAERPQKGREREFWQLNADIFGSESIFSDLEILTLAIDIMKAFNAPADSFIVKLNNRKLIDYLFTRILNIESKQLMTAITRKLDKYTKMQRETFEAELDKLGLTTEQIRKLLVWMTFEFSQLEHEFPGISDTAGYTELQTIIAVLEQAGYGGSVAYHADLIRGFDYYDGMIFEVFDTNPEFNRSVFGGGRYNGLADIFGNAQIPAVGFAPGNFAIEIFLDNWKLWPDFTDKEQYYMPILDEHSLPTYFTLVRMLRNEGKRVELGTTVEQITKALGTANKRRFSHVIIYGEEEMNKGIYTLKDMRSGKEENYTLQPE